MSSESSAVDEGVLSALRKYDTPTICNVLELLEVRPRTAGYMDARIQACFPKLPPMVGFATTATFRSAAPARAGDVYSGLDRQVELLSQIPGPKVVVFQDLDDPSMAATFGEVMCTTYQSFGCVGLITSGTGRDLDQVEVLNFPCFTTGTICSHGYCQIVDLQTIVRIGGVTIYPGDLLHGDRNGVTTIPTSVAHLVVAGCSGLAEAEAVVLNYLKKGSPSAAGYKSARADCSRRIKSLADELRRKL
ncbi:RraA family protein [Telmatocola sphagniphila]|uniref:Putative 4-hydroxy-4-methyl-2-oxoglutarate aldolase n=1 Tax=Telmatocola sphagniphila TaxID=1123043 RepID=A0A8E6B1R4_9BACT|nr:RraA family protein [Telmatocola sphagniphila]QVL30046.1 RraA family protein [Telmatocola sphagniphila]